MYRHRHPENSPFRHLEAVSVPLDRPAEGFRALADLEHLVKLQKAQRLFQQSRKIGQKQLLPVGREAFVDHYQGADGRTGDQIDVLKIQNHMLDGSVIYWISKMLSQQLPFSLVQSGTGDMKCQTAIPSFGFKPVGT